MRRHVSGYRRPGVEAKVSRLLVAFVALQASCGDGGEHPAAPTNSSAAEPRTSAPLVLSQRSAASVDSAPPELGQRTGILALRHEAAFYSYELGHIGEDAYCHAQSLALLLPNGAVDSHMTCRYYDFETKRQQVCAVHGEMPPSTPPANFVDLPSNLVPVSDAGRAAVLGILCTDLVLRASSEKRLWAFGPDDRATLSAQIGPTKSHVLVAVTHEPPLVRPIIRDHGDRHASQTGSMRALFRMCADCRRTHGCSSGIDTVPPTPDSSPPP